VQEFAVKVDQGFLIAVLSMFETLTADEESRRLAAFQRDCQLVDLSLKDNVAHTTVDSVKNFYDMLHFSPLKVSIQSVHSSCYHLLIIVTMQLIITVLHSSVHTTTSKLGLT